ncbi:MAG: lipase family protein [Microthrixaceae bacterium]
MIHRLVKVILALGLSFAIFGCSNDSPNATAPVPTARDTAEAPSTSAKAPSGRNSQAQPEPFDGSVEDFYVAPDPLPKGKAGDLIRVQTVSQSDDYVTLRIMYHSNDALNRDRATTGVVTYPLGNAPSDGWPVISTAHGTSGVASKCAPSRSGEPAPGWGVPGVWVMTDYVGMGPVGELHAYLSKPSEGNAVIDAVRAARQLEHARASTRWVSIGHSQGGHGALSAHELAARRAPELNLVATVALAPAAMLDRVYGGIDPIVTNILTMMALYSGTSEHPDLVAADYMTPEALTASKIFETDCLDGITNALIPVGISGPFSSDPRETEPARRELLANDVGHVAVEGVPLLLISGTTDDRVVIERARDLYDRLCGVSQVTEFHVIEGADHNGAVTQSESLVRTWLKDRLDGERPTNSCPAQPDPEPPTG